MQPQVLLTVLLEVLLTVLLTVPVAASQKGLKCNCASYSVLYLNSFTTN